MFERQNTIFEDEDILSDTYRPDNIDERSDEIATYQNYLQPIIEGSVPNHIFLYGKTGVGKTVTTRYLLSHLETDAQQYPDLDITSVYLNCENATSSYQVAIELVNCFRDRRAESGISETGHPRRVVYNYLWEELDAIGGTIVVVLDEIDHLDSDASILYQLPRARANENISSAKIGIIGISNDFTFKDELDPRILDTLTEKELHFPPYDANQLRSILSERAAKAFRDGRLADGVVPKCAALAASDKGSARQALDLLLTAGQIARSDDAECVTEAAVERAHARLQREEIKRGMRELTSHGKLALGAVVILEVTHPDETTTRKRVYQRYSMLADAVGINPLTAKSLHRHLSDLVMQGILSREERNQGAAGGRKYTYSANVQLEAALSALSESLSAFDFEELTTVAEMRDLIND
jgi:cell division control protein 6